MSAEQMGGTHGAGAASGGQGQGGVNRRRQGRVRTVDVPCSLGEVVDISASGLRVRGRGRPPLTQGQTTTMTLLTPAGVLAVDVGVAWARKTGWRHFEMGLMFVNITPDVLEGVRSVLRGATLATTELRHAA